jgi:two-component system LytT family sensor kinase
VIEILDNGSGMKPTELDLTQSAGIGLRNVDERLRVICGENCHLKIESSHGEGACTRIEIPDLEIPRHSTA